MSRIHLIEGPVGSGKSTFALRLGDTLGAPRLVLDEWMAVLFGPDRPVGGGMSWYLDRKQRCLDQIWRLTEEIVSSGSDVILELGLIQMADRRKFCERVEQAGLGMKIYVLDVEREVRRERVRERNRSMTGTYAMEVPDDIFELASDLWEPVDGSECGAFEVEFIQTGDEAGSW
jgi:predicted kinase